MERTEIETRIKGLVEELVSSHWESTRSVCYLSAIGPRLNTEIPGWRDALPMGLRDYLRRNPVVHLVEYPGIGEKVGAVPLSVSLPDDVRGLFPQPGETALSRNHRVAFMQEFWDGFIRPIEGHARYVTLDDRGQVTVRDEPPDNESDAAYEITGDDLSDSLPDQPIESKVDATHSAIERWLRKQSLEARLFARPRVQRRQLVVGSRLARLIGALDGLPDEDLARMTIPVDILIKLNLKDGD